MRDQKQNSLFFSTADILSSSQQSDLFKELQKNIQLIRASQVNVVEAFRRSMMSKEMQRGLRLSPLADRRQKPRQNEHNRVGSTRVI
jgi:hypothetical protein